MVHKPFKENIDRDLFAGLRMAGFAAGKPDKSMGVQMPAAPSRRPIT
jgi:hypothetical protein